MLFSMSSIVQPSKNITLKSCHSFLRSSFLIPEIFESPTMATVPFDHFTFVMLLLIWAELTHSFDFFLSDRSFRSACSPFVLRFKSLYVFPFEFTAVALLAFSCKLPFYWCYFCFFSFPDLVLFIVVAVFLVFTVSSYCY